MRTAKRALIWQGFMCIWEFFEKCNFTEWLSNYTVSHTYSVGRIWPARTPGTASIKKKKVQTFLVYQLSQTKLLAVNTCIFSVNCQICFSGILNHILYTLPRIYMLNQYCQLINVWKTSTSVSIVAGPEVSCPSHSVLQKWVLR